MLNLYGKNVSGGSKRARRYEVESSPLVTSADPQLTAPFKVVRPKYLERMDSADPEF